MQSELNHPAMLAAAHGSETGSILCRHIDLRRLPVGTCVMAWDETTYLLFPKNMLSVKEYDEWCHKILDMEIDGAMRSPNDPSSATCAGNAAAPNQPGKKGSNER